MKNILFFGCNGLIGSTVYNKLITAGYQVFTFGRTNCDYFIDLNHFKSIKLEFKPDILVHCAGVTDGEIKKESEQAIKRSTIELVKLVDWSKIMGVSHFVYVSTAHVYGNLNCLINETTHRNPRSLYSVLHVFAEMYIQSVFNKTVLVRPSAVYGDVPNKFNRWELIPFSFPQDLALKRKITLHTHGKQFRNFISTKTIAEIILKTISQSIDGIINPLGYHNMSIKEFAEFCVKTINEEYSDQLSLEFQSDEDYINKFEFLSNFDQHQENKNLLKNHVKNIYNNVKGLQEGK